MATLTIFDEAGGEVGTYEIDTNEIAATVNKQLLHDVVVMYQANLRQGSHNTRTRGELRVDQENVSPEGYRQCTCWIASHECSSRWWCGPYGQAPDCSYRLNRGCSACDTHGDPVKIDDGELVVVDSLGFDSPKTSRMASVLKSLGLDGTTTLVATADHDVAVYKSGRNITGVSVQPVRELNALSVLKPNRMLVTREALDKIKNGTFAGAGGDAAADTE